MNRLRRWGIVLMLGAGLASAPAFGLPSKQTPSSTEKAKSLFDEGYAHQEAGEYEQAIDAYEQSLTHDPKQAEALNNLGFCYKSLKRYHKAIDYYKDAIELKPDLAQAHEYLAEAYLALNKIEMAKREYRVLLRLNPDEAKELKKKIHEALNQASPPEPAP